MQKVRLSSILDGKGHALYTNSLTMGLGMLSVNYYLSSETKRCLGNPLVLSAKRGIAAHGAAGRVDICRPPSWVTVGLQHCKPGLPETFRTTA